MANIYICLIPVRSSPVIAEMKDKIERMGYKLEETPIMASWCKPAESVEHAKSIIREINRLGFGTGALYKNNRDVFIDLIEENVDAWKDLNAFKQSNGLV